METIQPNITGATDADEGNNEGADEDKDDSDDNDGADKDKDDSDNNDGADEDKKDSDDNNGANEDKDDKNDSAVTKMRLGWANRQRKRRALLAANKPPPIQPILCINRDRLFDESKPKYLTEIAVFVKGLLKRPLKSWGEKIMARIEVTTILEIALPNCNKKFKEKDRRSMPITLQPDEERCRSWAIWWIDPKEQTKRTKLFLVQTSLIPNAGYGLFAAQNYKADEVIGVYYGDHICLTTKKNNNYTLEITWPPNTKESRRYFITPKGGANSNLLDTGNAYFGIHMANDPGLTPTNVSSNRRTSRLTTKTPSAFNPNIMVKDDLSVVALADIKPYEEIFLDYNYTV